MRGKLTVDHSNNKIIMDRTFAKYEKDTFSEEYAHLQQVRRDYPTYRVELRKIKRNSDKETYKGLTYEYMEKYIVKHEPADTRKSVLMEFEDMIFISQCHSKAKRYPVIKNWFLEKYPEIVKFGMPKEEPTETKEIKVAEMPATTQEVAELSKAS